MADQDFATRVRALAADQNRSVSSVGYDAYDRTVKGTNPDTFKSVMAGRRAVTPILIEAVARVLGVPPEDFPEYRLALARHQLDEREVGLDQAVRNLRRIEAALARQPTGGSRASQPEAANPQPPEAAAPETRSRRAT